MADPPSKIFRSFFDDPTLSDLRVVFSSRQVHVHRVVLCRGSEYFTKLLTGKFLESSSNEIELKDDDPDALKGMLQFLYDLPYTDETTRLALPHVHAYIVADKYDIDALKVQILNDLRAFFEVTTWTDDIAAAAKLAFSDNVPQDSPLRELFIDHCVNGASTLNGYETFQDCLIAVPELGVAILCHKHLALALHRRVLFGSCTPHCPGSDVAQCFACRAYIPLQFNWSTRNHPIEACRCRECGKTGQPYCRICFVDVTSWKIE